MCPATFYCLGGAAPRSACPAATFAPPGANASAACAAVTYVDVSVALPVAAAEFSEARELAFRRALADASDAAFERVTVIRAVASRRAAAPAAAGSTVDASIAQPDSSSAAGMAAQLSGAALNAQLVRQGLPAGTLLSVGVREDGQADTAAAVPVGLAVAVALAATAALAGAAALWMRMHGVGERISADELRLREAVTAVREQVARARMPRSRASSGRRGCRGGCGCGCGCTVAVGAMTGSLCQM